MFKNKSTSIFGLLARENPNVFVAALIMGVLSGLAYALVFPILLYSFSSEGSLSYDLNSVEDFSFLSSPNSQLAKLFVAICFVIFLTKSVANIANNYLAQHVSVNLRRKIYGIIRDAGINDIEKIGASRIMSVINVDVISVVLGALTIPAIMAALITIVGLLFYLAYLSVNVFYFVIIFLFFGVISYILISNVASRFLQRSREYFDIVQEGINALIYGAKELKVNSVKQDLHHNFLGINEGVALKEYLAGSSILYLLVSYGDILVFAIIGIVAFHLSYIFLIDVNERVGILMSLLYISGPVGILLNSLPQITKGVVALSKIHSLIDNLKMEKINCDQEVIREWSALKLDGIDFAYTLGDGERFKLENITFEIKKGEITFLIGGNGSGKSTLAKIISMHYIPDAGKISLDTTTVNINNLEAVRQFVSAIYPDYYLFPKIYGYQHEDKNLVDKYLKMLGLDQKVSINNDGEYSTLLLSGGQKKRLALLSMLIENKEIYVFDEWASDQDPQYKKMFYEIILPYLKEKNKVVVAVTHDDAYFNNADKIICMDYGRIRAVERKTI